MAETLRLTALGVKGLKEPGLYNDGLGLHLQVTVGKDDRINKSWLLRFKRNGKERRMGLGSLHDVSLAQAREEAERCRKLIRDGKDPIELREAERAAQRAEAGTSKTFKACAVAYMRDHEGGWRNAKPRDQWRNTLRDYAYPVIGDLPVHSILVSHIVEILRRIWIEKNETARRVRGRIEVILDYAADPDDTNYVNPAAFTKQLRKKLPKLPDSRRPKHHPALPYSEAAGFMGALRLQEGISPRALEFLILTAARTGEVIGATWSEIDLESRVWTVPAVRMKGKRQHKVPLSNAAIAVLEGMHECKLSRFVFPGDRPDRPLSNMAIEMLLRRMNDANEAVGRPRWIDPKQDRDAVVHGFRSTFRDWAAEQTSFPSEIAEAALAHAKGDKTEASYQRGDFFDKRRKLMDAWARYCAKPAAGANVIPIRKGVSQVPA
jgi:integrase